MLIGRSEGFIAGRPDIEATIARLKAYASAGADCLYATGPAQPRSHRRGRHGLAPKTVNLLVDGERYDAGIDRRARRAARQRSRRARSCRLGG